MHEALKMLRDAMGEREGPMLVAFSGGPDSTFLALGLQKLGYEVILAHLDHGLHEESDAEVAHVYRFAEQHGMRLVQERLAPGALKGRGSVEAVARDARYAFLERAGGQVGANWVATGHTADDQAETVLLRLRRGAGLRGMAGIRVVRWLGPLTMVRPLLWVRKRAILDALASRGEPAFVDPTNRTVVFERNRLRHTVMPRLDHLVERLGWLAARSAYLADQSEEHARQLLEQVRLRPEDDPRWFLGHDPPELFGDGVALLVRPHLSDTPDDMLPWILEQAMGDPETVPVLERCHVEKIRALLDPLASSGKSLDLPRGWHAIFAFCWVALCRRIPEPLDPLQPRPMPMDRERHDLDPLPLVLTLRHGEAGPGEVALKQPGPESLWGIRGPQPGDVVRLEGGTKQLRRLLTDHHIPAFLRPAWPVVADADGRIIWSPLIRADRDIALPRGEVGIVPGLERR